MATTKKYETRHYTDVGRREYWAVIITDKTTGRTIDIHIVHCLRAIREYIQSDKAYDRISKGGK